MPPHPTHLSPQVFPLFLRVVSLIIPKLLPAIVLTQPIQVLH